jgi:hypothetical protein
MAETNIPYDLHKQVVTAILSSLFYWCDKCLAIDQGLVRNQVSYHAHS